MKYLTPVSIVLAILLGGGLLVAAIVTLGRGAPGRGYAATPAQDVIFPPIPARAGLRERLFTWPNLFRRVSAGESAEQGPAYAILEPVEGGGPKLELRSADVLIGRNVDSPAIALDDPSVSPRHARIVRMGDGAPRVFDLGSTAGSWINFDEVPTAGCPLREGDRLQFGRVAFRVRLAQLEETEEDMP